MKKFLVTLVLATLFLTSCTTTKYYSLQNSYNEKYKNSTRNEIYRIWGSPNRVVDMDKGEYILVYERYETNTSTKSFTTSNAYASANSNSYYNSYTDNSWTNGSAQGNSNSFTNRNTRTTENRYYTEFYMNKNDRCYGVRTTDTYGVDEVDASATIEGICWTIVAICLIIGPIIPFF